MPTTHILRNGVDIGSYFGAKGASTAATTGIKSNGTDLNQILLARADGVDIGFNTGILSNGNDLRNIFGGVSGNTPLSINGKAYNISAIFSSAGSGSVTFKFYLTSTSAWATNCSRTGTTNGNPPAGDIDTGTDPSGATQVRYTLTWLNASGDTSAASGVINNASTATALAANVSASITLNGNGVTPHQTTYNFEVEFLNSSNAVISTTNFTAQLITEGSA